MKTTALFVAAIMLTGPLAARGESLPAFDGRCIPVGCVAPPSNIPDILGRRALPTGRLARLGATPDFHHGLLSAQERKPVPKDSVRVFVPGCSKGMIFTAGARTEDSPGAPVPEGMHLRMSGPKDLIAEIKGHEGSRIEITGLMKKGQPGDGVSIGGGVRISPGSSGPSGSMGPSPGGSQHIIDVEGWRIIPGECRSR